MTVELSPVAIHKAPPQFKGWQFYEVCYLDEGEELWRGTIWLPNEVKVGNILELMSSRDLSSVSVKLPGHSDL